MSNGRTVLILSTLLSAPACAHELQKKPLIFPEPPRCSTKNSFGSSEPEAQKINIQKLVDLTLWVRDSPAPIFSILISLHGKIVYELYTSGIMQSEAHYLMSVTKSMTSALAGIAFDSHLLSGPDKSVAESLPKSAFQNEESYKKFQKITLRDALGMSALDAPVAPHVNTPEAKKRVQDFYSAPNRLDFALKENILPRPGVDFQYTDVTPLLISGAVEYANGKTLFDFAKESIFDPMGFQNEEWMHEDSAHFDNGAYGLRLRPIDMQKFGVLFLNEGCWEGRQLISSSWVKTSFTPWIRSKMTNKDPDYGWYWWKDWFHSGWIGHIANGWKGQRIAVFPDKDVVVTMTGAIGDGSEEKIFANLINDFVIPAVESSPPENSPIPKLKSELKSAIATVLNGKTRFSPTLESRMRPSETPKEHHYPFSK